MYLSVKRTIYGQVPAKSNQYRIGNGRMYKSSEVTTYERDFAKQWVRGTMIESDFDLTMTVYFASNRSDLDNALKVVLDCLQKVGAIKNDRLCREIRALKEIDRINPRIEIELTRLV